MNNAAKLETNKTDNLYNILAVLDDGRTISAQRANGAREAAIEAVRWFESESKNPTGVPVIYVFLHSCYHGMTFKFDMTSALDIVKLCQTAGICS